MKRIAVRLEWLVFSVALVSICAVGIAQEKKKQEAGRTEQGQQTELTLKIEGVECQNCSRVLSETLQGTPLKVTGSITPNTSGPTEVRATCPQNCDLGDAAAKVNKAATPHRDRVPPSLALVIFANLDDQSAKSAMTACQKISGVSGKDCQASAEADEIQIRISGDRKVTVEQILTAMKDAGVNATTKAPSAREKS
jgi:hypothetical protein